MSQRCTIDWAAQPWGTISDTQLARRLGVTQATVSKARRRLGIARCDIYAIDWDAQPLGQLPDPQLARRIGCSRGLVAWHRWRRGIPAFHEQRHRWTAADERVLLLRWGTCEPEVIARQLGRTVYAVILRGRALFGSPRRGTFTEQQVADLLGIWHGRVLPLAERSGVHPRRRPHSEKGCSACLRGRACRRPYAYSWEQVERLKAKLVEELNRA